MDINGSRLRSKGVAWTCSGICAMAMTVMLCAVIPTLLHQDDESESMIEAATPINVIRIPRPDSPVAQKTPPPPVKTLPKPQPIGQAPKRQMMTSRLTLPFEINPKLPAGSATAVAVPMASGVANNFGLPNIFAAGDLDQPLVAMTRMPPLYPLAARQRRIEGWVKVRFMVTVQGLVECITIVDAQPPGVFDQSVTRCVSGWRFQPGTVEGMPVNTWAETTVTFELKG